MDNLTNLIDALASKLGVAVDVLWAALIRQAFIAGIVDLTIIALLCVAAFYMKTWAAWLLKNENRIDEMAWFPFGVVAALVVVSIICVLSELPITLAAFFNPEYWAVNKILGTLK